MLLRIWGFQSDTQCFQDGASNASMLVFLAQPGYCAFSVRKVRDMQGSVVLAHSCPNAWLDSAQSIPVDGRPYPLLVRMAIVCWCLLLIYYVICFPGADRSAAWSLLLAKVQRKSQSRRRIRSIRWYLPCLGCGRTSSKAERNWSPVRSVVLPLAPIGIERREGTDRCWRENKFQALDESRWGAGCWQAQLLAFAASPSLSLARLHRARLRLEGLLEFQRLHPAASSFFHELQPWVMSKSFAELRPSLLRPSYQRNKR